MSAKERKKEDAKERRRSESYLRRPALYSYEVRVHIFQAQYLPAADDNGLSAGRVNT